MANYKRSETKLHYQSTVQRFVRYNASCVIGLKEAQEGATEWSAIELVTVHSSGSAAYLRRMPPLDYCCLAICPPLCRCTRACRIDVRREGSLQCCTPASITAVFVQLDGHVALSSCPDAL